MNFIVIVVFVLLWVLLRYGQASKLQVGGIVLIVLKEVYWNEKRRLCMCHKYSLIKQKLKVPDQTSKKVNSLSQLWFILLMRSSFFMGTKGCLSSRRYFSSLWSSIKWIKIQLLISYFDCQCFQCVPLGMQNATSLDTFSFKRDPLPLRRKMPPALSTIVTPPFFHSRKKAVTVRLLKYSIQSNSGQNLSK